MLANILLRNTTRTVPRAWANLARTRNALAPGLTTATTRVMSTTTTSTEKTHKHDTLWKMERYLSLALLGVLPAAWVIPHPFMDYAVATSLVVHVHWGIEAITIDYVRPSIFGPVIPKVSVALVYTLSALTLGGLFMFNWTDVGITQATRMLAKM